MVAASTATRKVQQRAAVAADGAEAAGRGGQRPVRYDPDMPGRLVRAILCDASLVLCVAATAMWVRSHSYGDHLSRNPSPTKAWELESEWGGVTLAHVRTQGQWTMLVVGGAQDAVDADQKLGCLL
jgi:hypothetical protein